MKLHRIWAVVLRNFMVNFRDFGRLIDFCYWPLLDIVVWGFTSNWIVQNNAELASVNLILLSSLVFWHILFRANFEVAFNLLDELWSRNVVNLFSTPLTTGEWIAAVTMLGITNGLLAGLYGIIVVMALYKVSILTLGSIMIPCIAALVLSGLAIGFLTASFLVYWGQKVHKLVWALGWFFAPFSAVFYPLAILPSWAYYFARVLPMTYAFEGIRLYITTGIMPFDYILLSTLGSALYLALAIAFFCYMLTKSKIHGLARWNPINRPYEQLNSLEVI